MRITSMVHNRRHVGVPDPRVPLFPYSMLRIVNASRRLAHFKRTVGHRIVMVSRISLLRYRVGLRRLLIARRSILLKGDILADKLHSRCHYVLINISHNNSTLLGPTPSLRFRMSSIV